MSVDTFPIDRAARHFLGSVSYSTPVPHWHDYHNVDHARLEADLLTRMQAYLAGSASPAEPYRILVPDRAGAKRHWLVPSVYDQIILETIVTRLARDIAPVDRERVYSYRYQELPNELAYYEDNFGAWGRFQEDTNTRAWRSDHYVLRLDLKSAFASFDREHLLAFVRERGSDAAASQLLAVLVESLEPGGKGLPHVNDSTFYVGNAYMVTADRAVDAVTDQFVRYIDNYHVFAGSHDEAVHLARRIEASLAEAGFALNHSKNTILSPEEFSVSASDVVGGFEDDIEYLSPPVGGRVDGDRLAFYVQTIVESPEEYLTKSFGRLVLGMLRQARTGGDEYEAYLEIVLSLADGTLIEQTLALLDRMWKGGSAEEWRVLCLLYVLLDFSGRPEVRAKLDAFAARSGPEVGELWIRRLLSPPRRLSLTSPAHQRGYLEEGRLLYGN